MNAKNRFYLMTLLIALVTPEVNAQWSPAQPEQFTYRMGNVGIGVSNNAGYLLDVRTANEYAMYLASNPLGSSIYAAQLTVHGAGTNGDARIAFSTTLTGGGGGHTGMIKVLAGSDGGGHMVFQTREPGFNSLMERLRITNAGKIGIGTSIPVATLDVNGSIRSALTMENNGLVSHGDIEIARGDGQDIKLRFQKTSVPTGLYSLGFDISDGKFKINGGGNLGEADHFTMDWNGNVGIGTSSPDAKLAVKGTVHSQEVRVDMTGALVPDYVFEKDYNLLPLSELETYISQNKHLPEVPSAKEMEAEGMNLKEMNLILLKKVEELTLHLIEKEKRMVKLEDRLKKLEEK